MIIDEGASVPSKVLLSKILELHLSAESKNNVYYSNCALISNQDFAIPFLLKSCPTCLIPGFTRLLLDKDLLSVLMLLLNQMTCEVIVDGILGNTNRLLPHFPDNIVENHWFVLDLHLD